MNESTVLIIGSSLSGLALAACLRRRGIDFLIIEKESQVASPWRRHYERLHLHTNKELSVLPYKKWPEMIPRYPSRRHVIDYLEAYQKSFDIRPLFETEAISIIREKDHWVTKTAKGAFRSPFLILATGVYGTPRPVHFKGMETFPGTILHSSEYKTGRDFRGQRVLVAGFGNSACEIAIDLYEHQISPVMAVRSPVNVIPRDWMGIPILRIGHLLSRLPARLADRMVAPLLRYLYGDLDKFGIGKLPYGPFEQIQRDWRSPVLDIGTIELIRAGSIQIHAAVNRIEGQTVYFEDGSRGEYDVIVAAIGYLHGIAAFNPIDTERLEDLQKPPARQLYFGREGLYFCGFRFGPAGAIREICTDAKRIAAHIAKA